MEDVPFEVLKRRPPRRSETARYEVERTPEAVIVTIHAGRKPTGGYSVKVRRVTKDGSRCVVHYAVVGPPPDAMVPQVITYPAVMVRIPTACADVAVSPPLERGGAEQ
ncbi:MAG: protease complex subunit PrcB family protein [Bryobacteraceae bacterium]